MSGIETVATAVKARPHSFKYIRKLTSLPFSDDQFMEMIKENSDRFQFTRIRREDRDGNPIRPGWPGLKLKQPAAE